MTAFLLQKHSHVHCGTLRLFLFLSLGYRLSSLSHPSVFMLVAAQRGLRDHIALYYASSTSTSPLPSLLSFPSLLLALFVRPTVWVLSESQQVSHWLLLVFFFSLRYHSSSLSHPSLLVAAAQRGLCEHIALYYASSTSTSPLPSLLSFPSAPTMANFLFAPQSGYLVSLNGFHVDLFAFFFSLLYHSSSLSCPSVFAGAQRGLRDHIALYYTSSTSASPLPSLLSIPSLLPGQLTFCSPQTLGIR